MLLTPWPGRNPKGPLLLCLFYSASRGDGDGDGDSDGNDDKRHLYYSVDYSDTWHTLPHGMGGRLGDYAYLRDKESKLRMFK